MKESDMPIADEILQRLKNQYGGITDAEIEELTTDNAKHTVSVVLCATQELLRKTASG